MPQQLFLIKDPKAHQLTWNVVRGRWDFTAENAPYYPLVEWDDDGNTNNTGAPLPAGTVASAALAGVQFPRDLNIPASQSWQMRSGTLVCANTPSVEYPTFFLPVPVTGKQELEMTYTLPSVAGSSVVGYLKVILPAKNGWTSIQLHPESAVFFPNGNRVNINLRPSPTPAAPRRLTLKFATDDTLFTALIDGQQIFETQDEGVTEVLNWKRLRPGRVNIGAETKHGPPITIHSIKLTRR